MSFLTILWISISLGMDCLAVSISTGLCQKELAKKKMIGMAISFGLFQGGMTLLGSLIGKVAESTFSSISLYIAFGILVLLGLRMIYNAFFCNADDSCLPVLSLRHVLILSLATSIDAFAIGISLAIIKTPILKASLIIGLTSFVMSFLGAFLGCFTGKKFENKIPETLGGLILIFIGIKLLF